MILSRSMPSTTAPQPTAGEYRPGACNIGPAEIARRRRAGHVAVVVAVALLALLVLIGAPPLSRLLLAVPVGGAASGYLQAWLKFCAGFGSRGVFNFGPLGDVERVADPESRSRDRARSMQIGLASLAIGIVVAAILVFLPL